MSGNNFTLIPTYILVISVLGAVFNIFVLMVFCFHKKACTVVEIYLSNLAGADLVLAYTLPFWAEYVVKGYDWLFSESLCKLVPALINMNVFCSIYFLVLLSIDRYVALVHPLSHERMSRPLYAKLGCLFVWSFGLVFGLHKFIYRKLVPDVPNVTRCVFEYNQNQYLMFMVRAIMFNFIIPISIIAFCTVRIIQAMNNRLPEILNTQRIEQKTNTLIWAVLLAFLICWVPFHVSKILDVLKHLGILSFHITPIMYQQFSICLAFFSSVLNPILYIIVGKGFRKRAKEFFKQ